MAHFIHHEPCPGCNSSDGLARYDDGSAHCFACKKYNERGDGTIPERPDDNTTTDDWTPIQGEYAAINSRKLTKETCEFWGYQVGTFNGQPCQIANIRDPQTRALVCQKLRVPGKKFPSLGAKKNKPFYGQWLWQGGGKHLVITEGELDALSVSQAFDLKWPVVSLPDGADSVEKVISEHYDWLETFERIVLMFDMDEPGRAAVEKAAAMLPVGRVAVATFPEKDANEVLVKHGPAPIVRAFWNAPIWRPDGIRRITDLEQEFFNPPTLRGIPYPWDAWNAKLGMLRLGEVVTFTAGSGLGKSTLVRHLIKHLAIDNKEPVGALMLEESNRQTLEGLVAIELGKNIVLDRSLATPEEMREAFAKYAAADLYLYDHFGSSDVDNIIGKMRYLVKACGVRWLFLDHLSILVSGQEGDERRILDMAMTKLRTFVSETGCGLVNVVHLKRPQGDRGHEDGAEVHLGQLRGSHSIAQLSDGVVGLQKDAEDPHGPNVTPVCLKNRWSGDKGPMGTLTYDRLAGTLSDSVF